LWEPSHGVDRSVHTSTTSNCNNCVLRGTIASKCNNNDFLDRIYVMLHDENLPTTRDPDPQLSGDLSYAVN